MDELRVGVSKKIITPEIGTVLVGYAPGRPSESVNDDLCVTAFALSQADKVLLITADVAVIDNDTADYIRQRISAHTGIAYEHIIICATHTHSAPSLQRCPGWSEVNLQYLEEIFLPQTLAACAQALEEMRPALTGVGTTKSEVGINRREVKRDGSISLGQCEWAPFDTEMTVISFREEHSGNPIGNIIHYGAHNTAAGCSPEITRDWAGPMVDCLQSASGAVTAFFNGAIGDTGPRLPNGFTTGNIAMAMELGARAGLDALNAYNAISGFSQAALCILPGKITLPVNSMKPYETAILEVERLSKTDLIGPNGFEHDMWKRCVAMHESGESLPKALEVATTLISVGGVVFIPFSFELFSEIALRIKKYSPFSHSLSLSCANGSNYYFPTEDQLCRGGYEVWMFLSSRPYDLVSNADSHAVKDALALLDRLSDLSHTS